ncbi:TetR/AcrR family transcriptional regulator [Nocardioides sp. SYSU DS0651]|uniref:TetR/AcrR family transcriptional regulator n=1 Tax=Nocardioides sp. SYSU DS0651 TaxID=3415955 RepID=UPI003F4BBE01
MSQKSGSRPVGRPRDPRIEASALAAVRELLVEQGYAGVTVAAVAERAGTTKAALYRRWPALPHLVYEAAFPSELLAAMRLGDDLHADLARIVRGTRDALGTPVAAAALAGLLPEFATHPELHTALFGRFAGVFGALDDRLRSAAVAGEADVGVQAADVLRLVIGATLVGLLLDPGELDDDWVERTATMLARGVRR